MYYNHCIFKSSMMRRMFLLLVIGIMICSCKKELSQEEAMSAIILKYNLPSYETTELIKEYYVSQYDESNSWFPAVGLWGGQKYSENKKMLNELQTKGVITLEDKDRRESNGLHWMYKEAVLTDKGKQYFISKIKTELL